MLLYRSVEHVARWLGQNGYDRGAGLSAAKLSELAHAWWGNRLSEDWRPRTREKSQAILDGLGLTGDYWRLG